MMREIEIELGPLKYAAVAAEIDPKKISTEAEAIQFSLAVVGLLKEKMKKYNASASKKVTLGELKLVYLRASAAEFVIGGKTVGESALARVNMFLRVSAEKDPSKSSWIVNQDDIATALTEATAKSLDKNFKQLDLYFEDEAPLTVSQTIRGLL